MKEINFTHDGKEYTLAFTRSSVAKLEQRFKFKIDDIGDMPASTFPLLFYGAFLEKQPYIKRDVTDKIYDKFTEKEALIGKLSEMYSDAINSLIEEPESSEGNVTWEANW